MDESEQEEEREEHNEDYITDVEDDIDEEDEADNEEDAYEDNEGDMEDMSIPVVIGNRPAPAVPYVRQPARQAARRSNDLVNVLSAPRIALYNVRSAWSKWSNISEDIKMRSSSLCFLTEVWQKAEKMKHQRAIESMLEMNGIKYISTPRPGARRGGMTAMACNQEHFPLTKLNIAIPSPLEACFGLLKPKKPVGKVTKLICASFYSPPSPSSETS